MALKIEYHLTAGGLMQRRASPTVFKNYQQNPLFCIIHEFFSAVDSRQEMGDTIPISENRVMSLHFPLSLWHDDIHE